MERELQNNGERVYVGNLTYETRPSELQEFCEKVGKVAEVKIIKRNSISLGFGFVAFEKTKDAQEACEKLNGIELDGRKVHVELARPQRERPERNEEDGQRRSISGRGRFRTGRKERVGGVPSIDTLFVSNLPYGAIEEDLEMVFNQYKPKEVKIVKDRNGNSRGYGFVIFGSEEQQALALKNLAGSKLDNRPLTIRISMVYPEDEKNII